MTVVLAGVGADSTNLGTLGPLYDNGRFEYIPIPEKTHETNESETLGTWTLSASDGTAADLTNRIEPQPVRGEQESVTGAKSTDDVHESLRIVFDKLRELQIQVNDDPEIVVQNIVTSADLGRNLNLNAIAIGLGLENIEYEPEQFPRR